MTNLEIRTIESIIGTMKISAIKDKDTRDALFATYINCFKAKKSFDDDMKVFQEKFFAGKEQKLEEYNATIAKLEDTSISAEERDSLVDKLDPKIQELVKNYNKSYAEKLTEEVVVEVKPVSLDAYIKAAGESKTNVPFAHVAILNSCGIIVDQSKKSKK